MPGGQRRAQSAPGIARRRLNPQPLEPGFPQDAPVGHAVQRHAAGQAQIVCALLSMQAAGDAQHDVLEHFLHGSGQIHFPLPQGALRRPGRAAEQTVEAGVGHAQPGGEIEVAHVQAEAAVFLDVDQLFPNPLRVARLSIGRQPHQLVFARIHLEARVMGERRIQQAQGVGKADLPQGPQFPALAQPGGGGGPFPHAIQTEDDRAPKRAGIEGGRRMGQMMLVEQQGRNALRRNAGDGCDFLAQSGLEQQFLLKPHRQRRHERAQAPRREGKIGFQQALEFEQRLVVEDDPIDVLHSKAALLQAEIHRAGGKGSVVLLAREPLLLGGSAQASVRNQSRGAVVIIGRDAQNVQCHGLAPCALDGGGALLAARHQSRCWRWGSTSSTRGALAVRGRRGPAPKGASLGPSPPFRPACSSSLTAAAQRSARSMSHSGCSGPYRWQTTYRV